MIVIDASAMLELLSLTPAGMRLQAHMTGVTLHAPHLIDAEILSALRGLVAGGKADDTSGARALRHFLQLRLKRYAHAPLLQEAWKLRHNLTAYDALYVVLARSLRAPLMTTDAGLATVARRNGVEVLG